jgi:hypothetical protein
MSLRSALAVGFAFLVALVCTQILALTRADRALVRYVASRR